MKFNYRVVKEDDDCYKIIEVYYDASGNIKFWSEKAAEPFGTDPEDLALDLRHMQEALSKPVILRKDLNEKTELDNANSSKPNKISPEELIALAKVQKVLSVLFFAGISFPTEDVCIKELHLAHQAIEKVINGEKQ